MNTTLNSTNDSSPITGAQPIGGFGYGIGLSLVTLVVFVIITCVSYTCNQKRDGTTSLAAAAPTTVHDISIITIDQHKGLDVAILSSYPQFTFSQLKPHKDDSTASACSICLADYDNDDLLRLLRGCGHLFHVKCVDPWLIVNPTCPICRYSTLPTPPFVSADQSADPIIT